MLSGLLGGLSLFGGAASGLGSIFGGGGAPQRSLYDEIMQGTRAQLDARDLVTEANREDFLNQQTQSLDLLKLGAANINKMLAESGDKIGAANTAIRGLGAQSDLDFINEFGGAIRDANRAANPEATRLYDLMMADVTDELESGRGLSDAETHRLRQTLRAGQTDRGFGYSPRDSRDENIAVFLEDDARVKQRRNDAARMIGLSQMINGGQAASLGGNTSNAFGGLFGTTNALQAGVPGVDILGGGQLAGDVGAFNANARWAQSQNQRNAMGGLAGGLFSLGGGLLGGGNNGMIGGPGGLF